MRVLHVLHHSLPHLDGYSVRSRSIVTFQRQFGIEPVVLTSAHHELEVGRLHGQPPSPETILGIDHYRTPLPQTTAGRAQLRVPFIRERTFMRALARSLAHTLARVPVDLIHAHSPVLCGIPAMRAARRLGVPFVYEVRAFWEDALLSSRPSAGQRVKYRYSRSLESGVLKQADAVVAISRHMLDEIQARGVPRSRLHHVPNGVDLARFTPQPPDVALAERLGIGGCPTIGFIGSFFDFEGLDCLVRALPAVLERVPTCRLVLVGAGEAEAKIRDLVRELGLQDMVRQVGRVPQEEVARYYSIMDVLVYPRLRERITELVTPLKPLEAMAMERVVVGSDVGGIKELLNTAGVLFKAGDPADLARHLETLLKSPEARGRLARAGRAYVLAERRWEALISRYSAIYDEALSETRSSAL